MFSRLPSVSTRSRTGGDNENDEDGRNSVVDGADNTVGNNAEPSIT